jgi:AcrR family transcriptional regulator
VALAFIELKYKSVPICKKTRFPLKSGTYDSMGDLRSPPTTRRERRRAEVRSRTLEAARALFEERGYDETKVSDICARADLAYGTFFNHFGEKRELLRGMAEEAVRQVRVDLELLAKQPGTIEDHLIALFEGGADGFEAAGGPKRDLLGKIHAIAYTEAPEQNDRLFHAAFEAFISEAVARGRVRSDVPVETLAEVVASTFSSLALSWVHFDDYPVRERAGAAARFLAGAL